MNERIKQLAEQAGFGPAWYDPTIPTSDIDRRWIDQRRLKEFAELIIKECMKLNHDHFSDEDPYSIDSLYRYHFGVEE